MQKRVREKECKVSSMTVERVHSAGVFQCKGLSVSAGKRVSPHVQWARVRACEDAVP